MICGQEGDLTTTKKMTQEFQETSVLELAQALLHLSSYLGMSVTKKEKDRIQGKVGELTYFYVSQALKEGDYFWQGDIFEEPTD